jgi:drug/metabolite transporter (DMT)-like permease
VAVFAPSFGLMMIVVPVIVGPLIGQTLEGIEMVGVALAIPAVVLLSGEGRLPKPGVILRSPVLGLAVVVGASIGTAGLLLTQAAPEAGEVPAFVVLVTGVMVMPWILRQRTGSFWPEREIVGFGSVLGASSAVAFVLSTAAYLRGSAAIVTALIAMSPGVSVVISWRFLGERLYAVQALGGAFGMAAVTAFALAG